MDVSWKLSGSCASYRRPDLWFSDQPIEQDQARFICNSCPVKETCLEYALTNREDHGIWGGVSERGRRRIEAESTVAPRGRAHRGYEGGPIMAPVLEPHERMTPGSRSKLGKRLRAEYDGGASIREISERTNYSITRVRKLLVEAGTEIRSRGAHPRG